MIACMKKREGEVTIESIDSHLENLQSRKDDCYIRLFDFYNQGLLSKEEAESTAGQLSSVKSIEQLGIKRKLVGGHAFTRRSWRLETERTWCLAPLAREREILSAWH